LHFSFEDVHVQVSFVHGMPHSPDEARTQGSSTSSQVQGPFGVSPQQSRSFGQQSGLMDGGPQGGGVEHGSGHGGGGGAGGCGGF
jgi:hypothetical protein